MASLLVNVLAAFVLIFSVALWAIKSDLFPEYYCQTCGARLSKSQINRAENYCSKECRSCEYN